MDRLSIPLNLLPVGCTARVKEIKAKGNIRRRMLDLGLVTGTEIEAVLRSPSGDPVAYHIRGAVIAFRSDEASGVLVEPTEKLRQWR
ncbi:MAG: ferrous iron transport protein A [Clostridiales bacterium]|jgi:ferrous iron transport protein A|nr:ferrous iron transport protein A [Clostridiales bacterium]